MAKNEIFSFLEGKRLDGYVLCIKNLSPGRFPEETNFEIFLQVQDEMLSDRSVVQAKYFSGRGKFYRPWLEIYYENHITFNSSKTIDLSENKLDEMVFTYLSKLLPPGSHLMVVYSNNPETREGLDRGVPAPATPLGFLLWKAGYTWFKNWYFSEGFWEGDIKLQGNKPLNAAHRKKNLLETRKELIQFLKDEQRVEKIFLEARKRTVALLELIEGEFSPDSSENVRNHVR